MSDPGLSLRSNTGLKLANAFGVNADTCGRFNANDFGVLTGHSRSGGFHTGMVAQPLSVMQNDPAAR